MSGPRPTRRPGWTTFLCGPSGWWTYERWVTPHYDLGLVLKDVVYGIEAGIMETGKDIVITLVEDR